MGANRRSSADGRIERRANKNDYTIDKSFLFRVYESMILDMTRFPSRQATAGPNAQRPVVSIKDYRLA